MKFIYESNRAYRFSKEDNLDDGIADYNDFVADNKREAEFQKELEKYDLHSEEEIAVARKIFDGDDDLTIETSHGVDFRVKKYADDDYIVLAMVEGTNFTKYMGKGALIDHTFGEAVKEIVNADFNKLKQDAKREEEFYEYGKKELVKLRKKLDATPNYIVQLSDKIGYDIYKSLHEWWTQNSELTKKNGITYLYDCLKLKECREYITHLFKISEETLAEITDYDETWTYYSDLHKDVYGVRPH